MHKIRIAGLAAAMLLLLLLAACGGGGGLPFIPDPDPGGNNPPANPPDNQPASGTWLADVYGDLPPEGSATRAFQSAAELNVASQILAILNQERADAGLDPLALDVHLERVAQAHGLDMAQHDFFAHENLYGMQPWDRLDAISPPPYVASGENIAAGQPDAATVMQGWMDSPGHRANILNDEFNYVGIGVYDDPSSSYGIFYVQLFAAFPADPAGYGGWYVSP